MLTMSRRAGEVDMSAIQLIFALIVRMLRYAGRQIGTLADLANAASNDATAQSSVGCYTGSLC